MGHFLKMVGQAVNREMVGQAVNQEMMGQAVNVWKLLVNYCSD